jgi:hypothetical protein
MDITALFNCSADGYILNDTIVPVFSDQQEASKFLVEVIEFWSSKIPLFEFMGKGRESVPEILYFSNPFRCPNEGCNACFEIPEQPCVWPAKIIFLTFGDVNEFCKLPFAEKANGCVYCINFELLKNFSMNGLRNTPAIIEERKQKTLQENEEQEELQKKLRKESEKWARERWGNKSFF